MLISILYVNIFINLFGTKQPLGTQFDSNNCYESFSKPKIIFKLFHYYPTSPHFLIVDFFSINYFLNDTDHRHEYNYEYYFKRFDGPCESSITFSTTGMQIYRMYITVRLYLSDLQNHIAIMSYTFLNGFNSDIYLFIDEYSNFGFTAMIIYSQNPFLPDLKLKFKESISYLSSLYLNQSQICVITKNNRNNIIHPYYNDEMISGFLVGIKAIFDNDIVSFDINKYNAFECQISEKYSSENTVFIYDTYPKTSLHFFAIYLKVKKDDYVLYEIPFYIDYKQCYNINTKKKFPINFQKIFFILKKYDYIFCPNGNSIRSYISEDRIPYYADEQLQIETEPYVKRISWMSVSPTSPCEQ